MGKLPNYTKIVELAAVDSDPFYFRVSAASRYVLFSLLDDLAIAPGKWYGWENDADRDLTAEEREAAKELVALAYRELLTEAQMLLPGMSVDWWASETVGIPPGWFLEDGSMLSVAEYPGLFAALGYAHGSGDDGALFGLPDTRGKSSQGLDSESGEQVGYTVGVKTQTQVAAHQHGVKLSSVTGTSDTVYRRGGGWDATINSISYGESGGIENRGPRLVCRKIIYAGV